jgi:hypothetical protein
MKHLPGTMQLAMHAVLLLLLLLLVLQASQC